MYRDVFFVEITGVKAYHEVKNNRVIYLQIGNMNVYSAFASPIKVDNLFLKTINKTYKEYITEIKKECTKKGGLKYYIAVSLMDSII